MASFFNLGQLEDPEFAVKNAVISLRYPGASPEEVELEVTDRIEIALQELPVFTSVLIIACPCALALASPFTLGNALRMLGKNKFYLKLYFPCDYFS